MRPAAASDTRSITPSPLRTPPLAYISITIAITSTRTPAVTCSMRLGSRRRAGTRSASEAIAYEITVGTTEAGETLPRLKKRFRKTNAPPTRIASTTRYAQKTKSVRQVVSSASAMSTDRGDCTDCVTATGSARKLMARGSADCPGKCRCRPRCALRCAADARRSARRPPCPRPSRPARQPRHRASACEGIRERQGRRENR